MHFVFVYFILFYFPSSLCFVGGCFEGYGDAPREREKNHKNKVGEKQTKKKKNKGKGRTDHHKLSFLRVFLALFRFSGVFFREKKNRIEKKNIMRRNRVKI